MERKVLVVVVVVLMALRCTANKIRGNGEIAIDMQMCGTDDDCRPTPTCHPMHCINQEFVTKFDPEQVCTAVYMCNAAYTTWDCACLDGVCTNLNVDRKDC
mmetsp:Transcript_33437/g.93858  ORF Transcript_33437/g.93858 Transcript_33437/m.93858 type:complete len:101 (-) Transcript_33437:122-424(-)